MNWVLVIVPIGLAIAVGVPTGNVGYGVLVLLGTGFLSITIHEDLKRRRRRLALDTTKKIKPNRRWKDPKYWEKYCGDDEHAFEKELGRLYFVSGYQVEHRPRNGGIDLVLRASNETVIVQCKAHSNPIGVKEIREFLFIRSKNRWANVAVFVSTSGFTSGAITLAKDEGLILEDSYSIAARAKRRLS